MGLFPKDRNLAVAPDRVELEVRASDFGLRHDEVQIRLDAFLQRHLTWRSRTSIQRLVRDGFVLVDPASPDATEPKEPTLEKRAGLRLHHGARVVVVIPAELRLTPVKQAPADLQVLYEDEEVIAVDKPPFLPVHPSGRHLTDTLIQRVHARYRRPEDDSGVLPIRLCHRLDRETSGIVLLGKGARAHAKVMRQFERRQVEKEYLAIVHGVPERDRGRIDLPLGPARMSRVRLKIAVVADGLSAQTEWEVVERHVRHALLRCRILTGRQHQIRVHLDAIGHPLVGDKLYGVDDELFLRNAANELTPADRTALGMERHALHNHRLAWSSPADGTRREVVCPLAADMRAFLDRG